MPTTTVQQDPTSSNNYVGWFYMFCAHLISACGIERKVVKAVACREALNPYVAYCQDKMFRRYAPTAHLSDNQCIMLSNRHFYSMSGQYIEMIGRTRKDDLPSFEFDDSLIDYWLKQR